MDKISISPFKLIPDMQIAETIFNEYGAVIISEGSILDEHMISKLKNLDIISVKVFKKEYDIVQPAAYAPTQKFKARYNEDVNTIREVMGDISSGKNIDLEKVQSVVNSVIVRINEKLDVVRCINQLRNTDEYTYAHSLNVSLLSMLIGKWLKMKKERIIFIIVFF
jgi:HD-GYP domain-containing protein (c-di-GMP phosphodiesterase class II)